MVHARNRHLHIEQQPDMSGCCSILIKVKNYLL